MNWSKLLDDTINFLDKKIDKLPKELFAYINNLSK